MKNIIFDLAENITVMQDIMSSFEVGELDKGEIIIEEFSNHEICPTLKSSVRGKRVFLLMSPQTSAEIMTLYLTIDAAKRAGAKEIIPILPFMPYSRGDKKDNVRKSISAKSFAQMLEINGATSLITFELHADQIQGFYSIPVIHIQGKDIFVDVFQDADTDKVVLCAPDAGAGKRVEYLLDGIKDKYGKDLPYVFIHKTRKSAGIIDKMLLIGDVTGKEVYVVDDMSDSGGTIIAAASLLLENGATKVNAILSHALFTGGETENKINQSKINKFYLSNSVGWKHIERVTHISCAPFIVQAMKSVIPDKGYDELS